MVAIMSVFSCHSAPTTISTDCTSPPFPTHSFTKASWGKNQPSAPQKAGGEPTLSSPSQPSPSPHPHKALPPGVLTVQEMDLLLPERHQGHLRECSGQNVGRLGQLQCLQQKLTHLGLGVAMVGVRLPGIESSASSANKS